MTTKTAQKIPKEWLETTLSEVAEKIAMGPFGSNIKVETFVESGVPIISSTHLEGIKLADKEYNFITEEHAKDLNSANVFSGDVIFTHAGNIGQVAYIPENAKYKRYVVSQRQFYLRPNKKKLLPEFLTYFFKTSQGRYKLLANSNQTGVPSLAQPVSYLKSIAISLPPLQEQHSIVAVLLSLDNKIDLLLEQNRTLENMAHTFFKKLFENQTNTVEGKTASELIEFNPREKIVSEKEYLYFDMKCLSETSMTIADGMKRVVSSGSVFRKNDTLMAKITPCLENGKTGFVFDLQDEEIGRGSTEFIVMRAKQKSNPFFVYCLARNQNFRNFAIKSMTGTSGRQRVQVDLLGAYKITVPKEGISKFGKFAEPVFEKIKNNHVQIQSLTRTRELILPKLMRGELRAKNLPKKT